MLGFILSKRKFIYLGYKIMKMNAINNATKLKVIFFLKNPLQKIFFFNFLEYIF